MTAATIDSTGCIGVYLYVISVWINYLLISINLVESYLNLNNFGVIPLRSGNISNIIFSSLLSPGGHYSTHAFRSSVASFLHEKKNSTKFTNRNIRGKIESHILRQKGVHIS